MVFGVFWHAELIDATPNVVNIYIFLDLAATGNAGEDFKFIFKNLRTMYGVVLKEK